MDSLLEEEDSRTSPPRMRRWPRLKPMQKLALTSVADQGKTVQVVTSLQPELGPTALPASLEGCTTSNEYASVLEDRKSLAVVGQVHPDPSKDGERDPAHRKGESSTSSLRQESGAGVREILDAARAANIQASKLTRGEKGIKSDEPQGEVEGTNLESSGNVRRLSCKVGQAATGIVATVPEKDVQAETAAERLHGDSVPSEHSASDIEAPRAGTSELLRSDLSSVRQSLKLIDKKHHTRKRAQVSESLTDIAQMLNGRKSQQAQNELLPQKQRPGSAREKVQISGEKKKQPLRRSVLTPTSSSLVNTGGSVQRREVLEMHSALGRTGACEGSQSSQRGKAETADVGPDKMSVSGPQERHLLLATKVVGQFSSRASISVIPDAESLQVENLAEGSCTAPREGVASVTVDVSERDHSSKATQGEATEGMLAFATERGVSEAEDLQEGAGHERLRRAPMRVTISGSAIGSDDVEGPLQSDGPPPVPILKIPTDKPTARFVQGSGATLALKTLETRVEGVAGTTTIAPVPLGTFSPSSRASLSAQKLSSILKYLEEVNANPQQTENHSPLPTATTPTGPQDSPGRLGHVSHQDEAESEAGCPADSISTASLEVASKLRRLEGPSSTVSEASFSLPRPVRARHFRPPETGASSPSSHASHGTGSVASAYQGVKAKLQALRGEVSQRDASVAGLKEEARAAQEKHAAELKDLEARHSASCQRQQAEYEAALARHLAFVDKLLGDKDKLAARCAQLATDVKAAESKFEERVRSIQEANARDLKKAREQWAAAEKVKREQWMADKVQEVKAMTVKGLEPQVQALIEKHKADVQRLEARHMADVRAHADKLLNSHEQESRHQRERLLKDKDDAIEQERNNAQNRLREMSERYEQQLILARMRVGADMAVQLERAEAARRDDKKRHEDQLALQTRDAQEREAALRQEMARAVAAAAAEGRAAAERATEVSAQAKKSWEKASEERVREECARREGEMRRKCEEQMHDELRVVMQKMAEENEEELERRVSEGTERVKQAERRAEDAAKERDEMEARLEKRIQSAIQAKADALQALVACQEQRESLARRGDMDGREIHSLRKEVESLTQKLESSDAEVRLRVTERTEQLRKQVGEAERRAEQLRQQLLTAQAINDTAKAKQAEELSGVESKVRQAIAQRDASVTQLQRQLFTAQQRIREMEQQQREFLESSM